MLTPPCQRRGSNLFARRGKRPTVLQSFGIFATGAILFNAALYLGLVLHALSEGRFLPSRPRLSCVPGAR